MTNYTENFNDAQEFKPFRWLQEDGTTRENMVKVGVDCLTFGAGRLASPLLFVIIHALTL